MRRAEDVALSRLLPAIIEIHFLLHHKIDNQLQASFKDIFLTAPLHWQRIVSATLTPGKDIIGDIIFYEWPYVMTDVAGKKSAIHLVCFIATFELNIDLLLPDRGKYLRYQNKSKTRPKQEQNKSRRKGEE